MLTPIDIETVEFKKVALGYAPEGVDEFLNKVIVEFESLYRDNAALKDRIKNLEESINYYSSLEESIKSAIVIADKAAAETKQNAADQAESIIKKAQLKADEILLDVNKEKYKLETAVADLKSRYAILSSGIKGLIKTELDYIEQSEKLLNEVSAETENPQKAAGAAPAAEAAAARSKRR
ncbi:MAG: DivIVA domain-containing protein [Clostridiales bacterium]|nr:DivIVA domain-containing protein [Clostridiales bacterium]